MGNTLSVVLGGAELQAGCVVTPVSGGGWLVMPTGATLDAMTVAEKKILERWHQSGNQDLVDNAVQLVEEFRGREDLIVKPSIPRKEGKEPEPEFRAFGKSLSGKHVSAFVNTETMTVNGKYMVPAVKGLSGAQVRSNGDAVGFSLANLDQCRAAMDAMLAV